MVVVIKMAGKVITSNDLAVKVQEIDVKVNFRMGIDYYDGIIIKHNEDVNLLDLLNYMEN